ncbi:long chain acyl-CoA synthetase 1 isoform X2 [Phoenix dactylifera]|uniref:Long-chain-fatty-acid--CoA ligase n=1 Tax=Phoenix dactylifera TaxID=42345 RepID=A0A8B9A8V5_PHODC|nr:long chain acyl-CoA synthetase 1 isoform X2 [Phoenix dactylifera]
MAENHTVQVESGRPGKDGMPSVGPVYRSKLAKNGFPPLDPGMATSWDVFRVAAEKYPGNRMLGWREFTSGKAGRYLWKTYKQIYEEVLHVGSALRQLGAEPGSRIGIYGANCPQWMVAMEACNGYSLICVPLYDTLGSGAINYIIEHAEVDVVFVQDKNMKEILSADCKSAQRLKSIVSFASTTREQIDAATNSGVKVHSWNEFLQMGKEYPSDPLPPQPLDICTIMYTSGTSGNPKGVILTHESHATFVKGVDLYMEQFDDKMTVDDVYLSFLPLAHILDRVIEEYFFHKGASVGYFQGNILALRDDLMELKPTFFAGVPRVFERIHEGVLKAVAELRPLRRMIFNILYNHKLSWMRAGYSHKTASPLADMLAFHKVKARLGGRIRLIISGGAPLSNEIEEFLRVTSCAYCVQGYGMTETCGLSSIGFPDDLSLVGTVGVASTYSELRLEEVPEMGYDPLAVPSRGEICIRGKTVFAGYYKNHELTKEVMIDGWFHTEMSPDGVLKIIDRKKNIFKLSQGEYVAVEYLEKVYSFTPIVEDIWVYGDSFQSMLVAVVAPHEDNTRRWAELNGRKGSFTELCALEELKKYILQQLRAVAEKNKLRGFEYIKGIVVDPLPFDIERDLVTPTMKKKRGQLLKYYQSDIEKLYRTLTEGRK